MNQTTFSADVATAADALAHAATHAADGAVQGTRQLASDATRLAQQGSDAAAHTAQLWRAQAQQWELASRRYIEQQRVRATLMAMAAGAALVLLGGLLLRQRHGPR